MPDALAAFLAATPAAGWARAPLAGDASARRYERLTGPGGATLILMDARAEPASLPPFLRLAAHLRGLGLAAPMIVAADEARGLALIEDLGPDLMSDALDRDPGAAPVLYGAAVDLLARLQAAPMPDGEPLARFTPTRMAGLIAPLFEHHAPACDPRDAARLIGELAEAGA